MNKTFEQTITKTYHIAEIYGTDDPRIPEGYEAAEFRLAKEGEDFLSNSGCGDVFKADNDWPGSSPRIILRKLPPEPTVESVYGNPNPAIPEGWEKVDFRVPEMGEYFLSKGYWEVEERVSSDWKGATIDGGPRVILRKTRREVPDSELENKGYEVVGFRSPKKGETCLGRSGIICTTDEDYAVDVAFFILQKVITDTERLDFLLRTSAVSEMRRSMRRDDRTGWIDIEYHYCNLKE